MKRTLTLLVTIVFLTAGIISHAGVSKVANPLKLHIDSVLVDSHNDTMMRIVREDNWLPEVDIGEKTDLQADLPKLRAGNISVPFFAAYSSPFYGNPDRSISRKLALFNALYWTCENNSHMMSIASNYSQIEEAVLQRKIAAVPAIEGAYSFTAENGKELLFQYHDLGVKSIGFTWNYSNDLGEGLYRAYGDFTGTPSSGGLTDLGIEIMDQMNRLGILVDVSHLAESSFWDVMAHTKSPAIASHSGAYSVTPHPRNLTDGQLGAIADNGGVVGVVYHDVFLGKPGSASVKDIVDHIDHIVKVAGMDHVGLGSDFDGAYMPVDMEDASKVYRITEELAKRGYLESDIKKILGLNFLRVIKENDQLAQKVEHMVGTTIIPHIEMGQAIRENMPVFTASITGNTDNLRVHGVVNGKRQAAGISEGRIEFSPGEALRERFYAVTFVATDLEGREARETRIIYFEQ